jgi:hypothetical protein
MSNRRHPRCRHDQFVLVDGDWSVFAITVSRGNYLVWRGQLLQRIDGQDVRVGAPRLINTRNHAVRWAREAIERAKAMEAQPV